MNNYPTLCCWDYTYFHVSMLIRLSNFFGGRKVFSIVCFWPISHGKDMFK